MHHGDQEVISRDLPVWGSVCYLLLEPGHQLLYLGLHRRTMVKEFHSGDVERRVLSKYRTQARGLKRMQTATRLMRSWKKSRSSCRPPMALI